jgi:hypothetical protein
MNENKRKEIEAKLNQLFSKTIIEPKNTFFDTKAPSVVKVIRRRKGKPDLQVT